MVLEQAAAFLTKMGDSEDYYDPSFKAPTPGAADDENDRVTLRVTATLGRVIGSMGILRGVLGVRAAALGENINKVSAKSACIHALY